MARLLTEKEANYWGMVSPRMILPQSEYGKAGWFVIVPYPGNISYRHFDNQEEAEIHAKECLDKLRANSPNREWRFPIHIEPAPGLPAEKVARLPIYGERPLDRALRDLMNDRGFGEWLMDPCRRRGVRPVLCHAPKRGGVVQGGGELRSL